MVAAKFGRKNVENMAKKSKLMRGAKDFPECPHLNFFKCTTAAKCLGCYYNPIKNEAMHIEDGDDKKPKEFWFYHSKKTSKQLLDQLEEIKNGIGLFPKGTRCWFKHSRKEKEDEE